MTQSPRQTPKHGPGERPWERHEERPGEPHGQQQGNPARPFRVPVLMYHHVEPAPLRPAPLHADSYITPEEFDQHLALLQRRGFTTLTLAEATRRNDNTTLPRRSVVLTFDDGCRCFVDHALPILKRHGMTATLFAVSGELGGENRWDQESTTSDAERRESLLDAAGLRRLQDAGIEVGCHSASHPDLSVPRPDDALAHETAGAKADLEAALGHSVETFCYPYGRSSLAAHHAVRAAGFRAAVSIQGHAGARAGDRWAIPRMILRPGEGRFELWLKARGWYAAWSRLPRLGILRAMRRRETP